MTDVSFIFLKTPCRIWQVSSLPCVHANAFIGTLRRAKCEDYVNPSFTVEMYSKAYNIGINPMPNKKKWKKTDLTYIIKQSTMKKLIGVNIPFWHLLENFWFRLPLDTPLGSCHSHSPLTLEHVRFHY